MSFDPKRIRVMQVVDTLDVGGAERVAVNVASLLPKERFESYLCTTRRDGPLEGQLASHVGHVCFHRQGRFDASGLRRMLTFLRNHGIQIIHAHGSSLFIARVAAMINRAPILLWHDHYGKSNERTPWIYRWATHGASVIAVNRPLADWSRRVLHVPADHVWYVPNFVETSAATSLESSLPGVPGRRIVCLANFRAQKDHMTLLHAALDVKSEIPDVQILLAGYPSEPRYAEYIKNQIEVLKLSDNVTCLGPREDTGSLLKACDIGVLSSASEGLPLALLEYGSAGLPVVSTDVGQCSEVLADGRAGMLVPASSPHELAIALTTLLKSPELRKSLGSALFSRVESTYHSDSIIKQICGIYEGLILAARKAA